MIPNTNATTVATTSFRWSAASADIVGVEI
ncbi:unnamed protein product, partial [Rotaria magnacalcarata]